LSIPSWIFLINFGQSPIYRSPLAFPTDRPIVKLFFESCTTTQTGP